MPLDHYISQVHLKNFYSPELGSLMYAIRKNDQKLFTPNAKSVCRIEEGNTNSFLREDRIVEEFIKKIEPRYNSALVKIIEDTIDPECIFVIAGFVAYVSTCSPAAIRIHSTPLKAYVEETAKILNSKNSLRPPPIELGGKSLSEFLEKKKIRIKINPKFPQAIGIQLILSMTKQYGNFSWDILLNPFTDSPFFTSDFPIAIERSENSNILNRIIPLSPYLSIRIRPNRSTAREYQDYTFSDFKRSIRKLNRSEIIEINRLIVRCAETTVFFRDNHGWVSDFVKKNSSYRIENRTEKIPYKKGNLLWSTLEIRKVTEHGVSLDRQGRAPAAQ